MTMAACTGHGPLSRRESGRTAESATRRRQPTSPTGPTARPGAVPSGSCCRTILRAVRGSRLRFLRRTAATGRSMRPCLPRRQARRGRADRRRPGPGRDPSVPRDSSRSFSSLITNTASSKCLTHVGTEGRPPLDSSSFPPCTLINVPASVSPMLAQRAGRRLIQSPKHHF